MYKILISIGISLVAGFLLGQSTDTIFYSSPEEGGMLGAEPARTNTVSLMIDSGEKITTKHDIAIVATSTVFSVLNNAALVESRQFEGLGVFVSGIDGISGSNDAWWQYWINNEYGTISSDRRVLEFGDVIFWKRTSQLEDN